MNYTSEQEQEFVRRLFSAYYDCRRGKRNSHNALRFEVDFEHKVFELATDIMSDSYRLGRSIAFMVHKPVDREIFAADFRDRVVHHYVISRLNAIFEKTFIYDSYSCRKGKGTLFGIERVQHFLRSCSQNGTRECYIMKLDVSGFFMNINRDLLYSQIEKLVRLHYHDFDKEVVLGLCRQIVLSNPVEQCLIRGTCSEWASLPSHKSLLKACGALSGSTPPAVCEPKGLPIGNLTSQVFANIYLHDLDNFAKRELKIKYYGRYVDDICVVHPCKEALLEIRERLSEFLAANLRLAMHPKKQYLQQERKGVPFLGAHIYRHYRLAGKRTKSNFCSIIADWNTILHKQSGLLTGEQQHLKQSQYCSFMGFLKQHNNYRWRRETVNC